MNLFWNRHLLCPSCIVISELKFSLELKKCKNRLVSVKDMLVLKLPRFFSHHVGEGKSAAISKKNFTEASPFLFCLSSNDNCILMTPLFLA